jgi:hypothetical protein
MMMRAGLVVPELVAPQPAEPASVTAAPSITAAQQIVQDNQTTVDPAPAAIPPLNPGEGDVPAN